MEQRREGFIVSGSSILRKARAQAVRMKINNFKGSAFWIFSFMKRNKFAMRAVSSVGQKLPDDWVAKMESFVTFITQVKDRYSLQHIGNMDKVPITFDMPSKFTVEIYRSTDVRVTTTGTENSRFTVVLCFTADESKLSVYVIFDEKQFLPVRFHRISSYRQMKNLA